MSQRKSATVVLGITALLAPSLVACSSDDSVDNQAVCVDEQTQERVPDDQCNEDGSRAGGIGGGFFLWYFLGTAVGRSFPPIGQRVGGGTFSTPGGSYRRGGVPTAGGSVPRGGFGGGTKSGSSGS